MKRIILAALAAVLTLGLVGVAAVPAGAVGKPITAPANPTLSPSQFSLGVTCAATPTSTAALAALTAKAAKAGHPVKVSAPTAQAPCATATAGTAAGPNVSVSFGWYIYLHFSPSDVDAILWDHAIGATWSAVMAVTCAVFAILDPIAGAVCAGMAAFYLWWLPAIFQTAHARNNGGVTFDCSWLSDLPVGYYYSGNGQ